ncbi:hypothetical protein GBA52_018166, partial [Prunus armeniaca]
KLDLWRLPEILVIHLKLFSYSRCFKNKLETYVDFPDDNLDLPTYISYRSDQLCNRYMLYAVSNHYGISHGADRWSDFDDSHVNPISQDKISCLCSFLQKSNRSVTSELRCIFRSPFIARSLFRIESFRRE